MEGEQEGEQGDNINAVDNQPGLGNVNIEILIGTVLGGVLSNVVDMDVFEAIAAEIGVVMPDNPVRRDVLRLLRARLNTTEFEDLADVSERLTRVSQILRDHLVPPPAAEVQQQAPQPIVAAPQPNVAPVHVAVAPAAWHGLLSATAVGNAVPPPRIKTEDSAGGDPVDSAVRTLQLQRLNEFKIKGSIGDPGEKGKLDFGNLSYQIQGGRKRGYSDTEICVGVVAAMAAGSELRSYLERVDDLSLDFTMKILRAHFKVQEAASMLAAMQNTAQDEDESLIEFCMKLMIVRDDVNLLSKQEPVPHDPVLVQNRFQHALYTGIRNSNIRQQLKDILKKSVPQDAQLLSELADIALTENICKEKSKSNGKGNGKR